MKIVFRADSSLQIGTGHVIRCRTLARTLRERGAEVTFVCRAHEGNVAHLLERDGFPMRMLPVAGKAPASPDPYASWVGATEEQDARETSAAIDGSSDLLVVDHYGLSAAWEKAMRGAFGKILALDDLGRSHATDVLMDQNFSRTPEARYEGRAGDAALLLGPRFALLQPEYAALAAARTPRATAVRRILIFFGGVDRENLTGRAWAAVTAQSFDEIVLDLVLGTADPHAEIFGGRA
ncbi:MAG: UDP-2,4-diacetamido-2,4,6-trideoxy-beta-L-altropyranose hydrolase, partial [Rhodospirillaceae bacterium]